MRDCKGCPNEGECNVPPDHAYKLAFADCEECLYSKAKKDGGRRCIVKCIDCSVREGRLPCTKFKAAVE